jgi:hypothetical protein
MKSGFSSIAFQGFSFYPFYRIIVILTRVPLSTPSTRILQDIIMIKDKRRFAVEVLLFAVILFLIYSLATKQGIGDAVSEGALTTASENMSAEDIKALNKEAKALAGSINTPAQAKNVFKKVSATVKEAESSDNNEDVMNDFRNLND